MVKKKKKSKNNKTLKNIDLPKENAKKIIDNQNSQEAKSSITSRIEKAKKANVFEEINPSEHVAKLKKDIFSITEKQMQDLKHHQPSAFPWTEFLIGFSLGCVLLVVMFLFHISFAKSIDVRISHLENRLAMLTPIITSPDTDYLEILTQQTMFESELNRLKRKLEKNKSVLEIGIFSFNTNKYLEKKIYFSKYFKKPIVFFQVNNSNIKASIEIDKSNSFFICKIGKNNTPQKQYKFSWLAIEK